MPLERSGTRGDTAALVACIVLSLVALALPEGLREPVASALRQNVLRPALAIERSTVQSAENRQQLDVLRAERDSLAMGSAFLPQLQAENQRLRQMLGLGQRLRTGFVNAEVLRLSGITDQMTLVLSAGRRQGVQRQAAVLAPEGLVGLVYRVEQTTSVALAWTHPDFRASAMVEGERVYGIVAARRDGATGELMELRGIAYQQQLPAGTRVVTSGLGGVFPRGVPLGTVEGVLSEASGWERTYLLRPAVHPAEASHVMILERVRGGDTLSGQFTEGLGLDSAAPGGGAPPAAPPPAFRPMDVPAQRRGPARPRPADTTQAPAPPTAPPLPSPPTDTLRRP